jgi:NADPH:quinone reductase-like Zn-dependent oxidoreductase
VLERVRELGADAVVALREESDLNAAYNSSVGVPVNVIVDYVWGRALEAALHAAATGARIVSEVEQAWSRQRAGVRSRLVLTPGQ